MCNFRVSLKITVGIKDPHVSIAACCHNILHRSIWGLGDHGGESSDRAFVASQFLDYLVAPFSVQDMHMALLIRNIDNVRVKSRMDDLGKILLVAVSSRCKDFANYGSTLASGVVFSHISESCDCYSACAAQIANICIVDWDLKVQLIIGEVSCLPQRLLSIGSRYIPYL